MAKKQIIFSSIADESVGEMGTLHGTLVYTMTDIVYLSLVLVKEGALPLVLLRNANGIEEHRALAVEVAPEVSRAALRVADELYQKIARPLDDVALVAIWELDGGTLGKLIS